MTTAIVGLGSNLGSREALIHAAQVLLRASAEVSVVAASPLYETEPVGPPQGPFLNAAVRLLTSLTPERLLETLLRIERRLGRVRDKGLRWGPRAIDLDLLWFEGVETATDALTLPHPGLLERPFALRPLLDVAPELEAQYGQRLAAHGSTLEPWNRSAVVVKREVRRVSVEADSLLDALCLCAAEIYDDVAPINPSTHIGRHCSVTRHSVIEASPSAWAQALCESLRAGLVPVCVTVRQCSESQWAISIHGEPQSGAALAGVSVEVNTPTRRNHRCTLSRDF